MMTTVQRPNFHFFLKKAKFLQMRFLQKVCIYIYMAIVSSLRFIVVFPAIRFNYN